MNILTMFAMLAVQTPGADVPAAAAIEDPDKIECRRLKVVNSRIPARVCYTRAEWAERAARTEQELRDGKGSVQPPSEFEQQGSPGRPIG